MLPSLLRRMGDSPWKMLAREKNTIVWYWGKKSCLFAEFSPCVTERAPHSAGEPDKEIKTILFHKACQGHSVEKERRNDHHHVVLQGIDLCCARQFCSSSTNRWHHESQCGVECERKKTSSTNETSKMYIFTPEKQKTKDELDALLSVTGHWRSKPSVTGHILHHLLKSVNTIYPPCTNDCPLSEGHLQHDLRCQPSWLSECDCLVTPQRQLWRCSLSPMLVITSMTGRENDCLCGRHCIFKHVLGQQGGLRLILASRVLFSSMNHSGGNKWAD